MSMAEELSGEPSRWKLHHKFQQDLSTCDKEENSWKVTFLEGDIPSGLLFMVG